MKILVTGGAGFIGSHLVDKLIELKHDVTIIDDLSSGNSDNVNGSANLIIEDIVGDFPNKIKEHNFDYIFHLAAIPKVSYSVENPVITHETNVEGTLNVLEYARYCKVKKVIFASSSAVYGDAELPLKENFSEKTTKSPYALHKLIGELYMGLYNDLYNVPTVSLRFFNVYGPRCDLNSEYSLVIGKFQKMKDEGKPLTIYGDGEQTRDFVHVSDIVDGLVASMEKEVYNEVINLCSGKSISINKVADLIGGEKKYLPPRLGDVKDTLGDNSKARKLLDWKPKISIEKGIKLK